MTKTADPYANIATDEKLKNSAGGDTFAVTDEDRILRFLILGSEGGTYYAKEKELTLANATFIVEQAKTNGPKLVELIKSVSLNNRAPKVKPTIFALAIAAKMGNDETRKLAFEASANVLRTGTHLFLFVKYLKQFGGFGRATKRAVARFFVERPVNNLATQMLKYQQREGVSMADLLRLSHPEAKSPDRAALFDWTLAKRSSGNDWKREVKDAADALEKDKHAQRKAARQNINLSGLPLVQAYETMHSNQLVNADHGGVLEVCDLIASGVGITWEMIPDKFINEPAVWEALLDQGVPQTALMRQLPRLTKLGLLSPMAERTKQVVAQLTDSEKLLQARVHPLNVLVAHKTYAQGHGMRSTDSWTPSRPIVDALDTAFYAAYGSVQPANKRTLLALDISGSMGAQAGSLPLTAREVTAAVALVTAATEPTYQILGFTGPTKGNYWGVDWIKAGTEYIRELAISPNQRLDDVLKKISSLPMGPTDCALPMRWALENKVEVDTFIVYTDNEHWAGKIKPDVALNNYREKMGIPAKLVAVATTATEYSIGDPNDAGTLNVAGFDIGVPHFVSQFSRQGTHMR
jgi:60 kDa SS-A/Ro ribonucleoprotein